MSTIGNKYNFVLLSTTSLKVLLLIIWQIKNRINVKRAKGDIYMNFFKNNPLKIAKNYNKQKEQVLLTTQNKDIDAGLLGSFHEFSLDNMIMTLMLGGTGLNPKDTAKKIGPYFAKQKANSKFGFIHEIGVEVNNRGKGYGNELLEQFIQEASKRDARFIFLLALSGQPGVINITNWYLRHGFKELLPANKQSPALFVLEIGENDTV